MSSLPYEQRPVAPDDADDGSVRQALKRRAREAIVADLETMGWPIEHSTRLVKALETHPIGLETLIIYGSALGGDKPTDVTTTSILALAIEGVAHYDKGVEDAIIDARVKQAAGQEGSRGDV